jgi:DNA (cytosine-5)-methyltransferase 1
VDIVTAGFPCQPWAIGGKHRGKDDPRNLWPDTVRIIREAQPSWVLLENSPKLLHRSDKHNRAPYIEQIIADLACSGYVGRWGCLSAAALGFEHKRERLWIVAHASRQGRPIVLRDDVPYSTPDNEKKRINLKTTTLDAVWNRLSRIEKRLGEPSVFGTNDGMAHRVDRLAAIGEGQVPAVVATAWELLKGQHS